MKLNTIKPSKNSKPQAKRLGRGTGSGLGKTSGKGHKGQHARAGGLKKVNFEGGQMPLQRRLPKFGFSTDKNRFVSELPLFQLEQLSEKVDLAALKQAKLIPQSTVKVRIYLKGELTHAVEIVDPLIYLTKGAKDALLAKGGKVVEA